MNSPSTSSESASSGSGSGRKRGYLTLDERDNQMKRLNRTPSISADFQREFLGLPTLSRHHSMSDRFPKIRGPLDDIDDASIASPPLPFQTRSISSSSSFADSVLGSPSPSMSEIPFRGPEFITPSGMALMRKVSSVSLASIPPPPIKYPELSAKHFLRNTNAEIDFSLPPCAGTEKPDSQVSLACSSKNMLYFTRGNRVYVRNLARSDNVNQLCKTQVHLGGLKMIAVGGVDRADTVAISTTKGTIQLWDVNARKCVTSWTSQGGVEAIQWNGPVLTVGGTKGYIRYYDTRINPASKMKDQASRRGRHEAPITNMAWNVEGKLLASADESGLIYCWDNRQSVPLDVGEIVQRRKKMQHSGKVTALGWCPWQAKLLASGDVNGFISLWNIDASTTKTNVISPGKLDFKSRITGLHWSPQCKEILSTHGPAPASAAPDPQRMVNSVVVHSYASLREVTTQRVADHAVMGSVLDATGTKLVLAVPEEKKLKIWEAWGKTKNLRRQSSFMDARSTKIR